MNKEYTFTTDKLQTRKSGNVREIVGTVMTRSEDSYGTSFTDKAFDSFIKQVCSKKVMIDVEHQSAFLHNIRSSLRKIMKKAGLKPEQVKAEVNTIIKAVKYGKLPVAKIFDTYKNENGEVDLVTRTNEAFGEADADHNSYYQAVLKSIDNGFIDGYSISFFPRTFKMVGGRKMIDELVVTGVALTGGRSNADTGFASVVTRCAMDNKDETLNEVRMATQEEIDNQRKETDAMKVELEALKKAQADRETSELAKLQAEEEVKLKAEAELKAKELSDAKLKFDDDMKELEELRRQKTIADSQGSHSAGRRGLAPQGNPSGETTPVHLNDQVKTLLEKLDNATIPKSPLFKRSGRLIVDPYAHKKGLADAVRLQLSGNTHLLKPNARAISKDSGDLVTNKL